MNNFLRLSAVSVYISCACPCAVAWSDTLLCEGTQHSVQLDFPQTKQALPTSIIIDIEKGFFSISRIELKRTVNSIQGQSEKFYNGNCSEDALANSYKSCVTRITETPSEYKIYKKYDNIPTDNLFKATYTVTISINRMSGKLSYYSENENGWVYLNKIRKTEVEISADCSKGIARF